MRTISSIVFLLLFGEFFGQDKNIDAWITRIDSLRKNNKLIPKQIPYKTFAGSMTGYFSGDSLVFINTLTDAEVAGTETQYYIKNGALQKVLIMAAQFDSHEEWTDYFTNHKKNMNCHGCHSKSNCERTVILYSSPVFVSFLTKGRPSHSIRKDNKGLVDEVTRTYKELRRILQEF